MSWVFSEKSKYWLSRCWTGGKGRGGGLFGLFGVWVVRKEALPAKTSALLELAGWLAHATRLQSI